MSGIFCYWDSGLLETKDKVRVDYIELGREESHHLVNVLRIREKELVFVIDGKGSRWISKIEKMSGKNLMLKVLSYEFFPIEEKKIVLVQSLLTNKNFEDILKYAVEIGVREVYPLITDRTEVKLREHKIIGKVERWEGIIKEAAKQSHNYYFPILHEPIGLADWMKSQRDNSSGKINFVCSLKENAIAVMQVCMMNQDQVKQCESIQLLIGPEGDFSEEEYGVFDQKGFYPIKLSDNILRSETATKYALSVLDQALKFIN